MGRAGEKLSPHHDCQATRMIKYRPFMLILTLNFVLLADNDAARGTVHTCSLDKFYKAVESFGKKEKKS